MSPMCVSPRYTAISAKRRISKRCWVSFRAMMTARHDAADRCHRAHALRVGRRALGMTGENPPVGCLIVRGGQVVGVGATAPGGRPHAETQALAMAGGGGRGATAYVPLEPSCHPWPPP